MTARTCETCRFLVPDKRPEYAKNGYCHRFPPVIIAETVNGEYGGVRSDMSQHSPWMTPDDFCGEHQPTTQDTQP